MPIRSVHEFHNTGSDGRLAEAVQRVRDEGVAAGEALSHENLALLRIELLDPSFWSSILEQYGRTMNMAVGLTDAEGHLLGECYNAQPIWRLAGAKNNNRSNEGNDSGDVPRGASGLDCPFCIAPAEPCTAVEETLRTGEVVVVHDRAGLAHVAVPLLLGGRPMGAIIAGQVFDEYPQPLRLQQVAQIRHVSNQELWKAATRSVPVRGATLRTYGELLKSLGQAFMHERYAVVLSRNLETALQEKIILLKEVHHRVKNNLAVIAALLGMQADSLGDHKAITPLLESQQRVHAIALTHEHLYGTQNLKSIRFDEYADQLATDLCATYSSPPNVRVVVDAEPIELDLDHAIPCGLVLNELLSNAFKYAFPGGRSGALTVGFERNAEGLLTLSVEDDGVGLPEGFDWRNSSSLGLRIVQILASQLEGDVELRSQGGTRVEFTFPNREPASPSVAVIG